jgi:hypothetical protein
MPHPPFAEIPLTHSVPREPLPCMGFGDLEVSRSDAGIWVK